MAGKRLNFHTVVKMYLAKKGLSHRGVWPPTPIIIVIFHISVSAVSMGVRPLFVGRRVVVVAGLIVVLGAAASRHLVSDN